MPSVLRRALTTSLIALALAASAAPAVASPGDGFGQGGGGRTGDVISATFKDQDAA